jgi:hypothetical protein
VYKRRVYVPNSPELRSAILKEMHNVPYARHPGYHKTISIVKSQYYWPGMIREIVEYLAKCLECQKLKADHRHPARFLQPLPIPQWKWKIVTMDFITGFSEQVSNMKQSWWWWKSLVKLPILFH